MGLFESLESMLRSNIQNKRLRTIAASLLTILPPYLTAVFVSNAFIAVLGFAGMILVVIAILLPSYLLYKLQADKYHYPELKNKWLMLIFAVSGVGIMCLEISNMCSA